MPSIFSRNKNKTANLGIGVDNSSVTPFPINNSLSPSNQFHNPLSRTVSASSSDARPLPDLPRGGLRSASEGIGSTGIGSMSIDGKGPTILPTSDSNGSGLDGGYHRVTEMSRRGSSGPTDYSTEPSTFYSNSDYGGGGGGRSNDSEFGRIRDPTPHQSQSLGYAKSNGYTSPAPGNNPIANGFSYNSPVTNSKMNLHSTFPSSINRANASSSTLNVRTSSGTQRNNTITRKYKSGNTLRVNAPSHSNGGGSPLGSASLGGPDLPEKDGQGYLYGYSNIGLDTQLDVERVEEIVRVCGDQIRNRGLDSPLIFSSMALDLSPSNTMSLIRTLLTGSSLGMTSSPSRSLSSSTVNLPLPGDTSLPTAFLHEIRFANSHDLAAIIKWAMAKMGFILEVPVPAQAYVDNKKGEVIEETAFIQQRGFIEIEAYLAWREGERRQHYPEHAFSVFLSALPDNKASLVSTLFSLLSSATSYSLKNGMTPSKLSRLFGVLIFGLPEDETFARTYDAYLKASNAMEHLFLAYIRDQSTSTSLPTRLLEHITGYPDMLSSDLSLPSARAKSLPITQIEKSVRLYSADLIQDACELDLQPGACPEWDAARGEYNGTSEEVLKGKEFHGMDPQLSDRFRKLVNLRGGKKQGRDASGQSWNKDKKEEFNQEEDLEAYGSLAGKEWGDFMSVGFSAPDESKLTFDLRETERKARNKKRETVQWSQFEELGFKASQEHDGLDKVLAFDDGLKDEMSKWPEERAELLAKLRSQQKKLPPFPYDTTPRVVASPTLAGNPSGLHPVGSIAPVSRMDDTFPEVFADLLVGNGWSNRDELTHRSANFVVVQYKSRATPSTVGSQAAGASSRAPTSVSVPRRTEFGETIQADSRVDAAWFVISEIVPQQYRDDLEAAGRPKSKSKVMLRKLNVFSRISKKDRSNTLENWEDPDDVFRPGTGGTTKVLKLNDPAQSRYTPVTDLHHSGTVSSYTSTAPASSLHTSASLKTFRPQNERSNSFNSETRYPLDDAQVRASAESQRSNGGQPAGNNGSGGAGSRMFNALRAKSKRAPRRKEDEDMAPLPPPKAAPPLEPLPGGSLGITGIGARDHSFSSADFETKSLHDAEEDEYAAREAGVRRKKNPLARHSQKESKDDAWIDVLMKNNSRMTGQDAVPSSSSNARDTPATDDRSTPTPTGQVASSENCLSAREENARLNRASPHDEDLSPELSDGSPMPIGFHEPSVKNQPASELVLPSSQLGYLEKENEFSVGVGNSSLDSSNRTLSNPAIDHPRDVSGSSTLSVPTLEAGDVSSASSGGSLRSRKSSPGVKDDEVQAAKDSTSLARSLREKLNPVEGSPLKKKNSKEELSTINKSLKPKLDPFAKDRTQGRVASIANNFGGPGKAGGSNPLSPQGTGGSFKSTGRSLSPVGPNGGTSSPIPARSQSLPVTEEIRAPAPPPLAPITTAAVPPSFPTTSRPASSDYSPSMPPSPRSVQGGDAETIYPDDAASNYSRDTHSTDENDPRSSTYSHPSQSRPISGFSDTAVSEEGGYKYRADEGRTEDEDEATAMSHQPVTPYTPGLPLENVMEESESVLSGSNNG